MTNIWRNYAKLQQLATLSFADSQELMAAELELNRELEKLANECREHSLQSQEQSHA